MIVLGIDPGSKRIGYGVIRNERGKLELLATGILGVQNAAESAGLATIKLEMDDLIAKFKPDAVAIENIYFAKNRKTAIAVAQARGIILLAAQENGSRIEEYSPNEVKAGVAGHGLADKKAVLKMVKLILGDPSLDIIDDASDAIAIAIVACRKRGL